MSVVPAWWWVASVAATPPQYAHIEAGDRAWTAGERDRARVAWSLAADSAHPATAAMAEARLLQVSGNLGLAVHGPRLDEALRRCPSPVEWCTLAAHDAAFFQHRLGIGPAPSPLLPSDDPDIADAIARRHDWTDTQPRPVPTWMLGAGPYGASGLGFGAALLFRHPDLFLRGGALSVVAAGTTSRDHLLATTLDTPGRVGAHVDIRRQKAELEDVSSPETIGWAAHSIQAGPRWTGSRVAGHLAGAAWMDHVASNATLSAGLATAGRVRLPQTLSLDWHATAMRGDAHLHTATVDLRKDPGDRGLAARTVATVTAASTAPTWRQPGWGGGTVLRHGPFLAYQAPLLVAVVAEWRQPLTPVWQVVGFGEAARTANFVGGIGGGLRVALPPRPSATLRLDVAVGGRSPEHAQLGVSTGWGASF